jgi:hypothetical protein
MSVLSSRRPLLERMEISLLETSRHLGLIQRQIEARAERMTITSRTKRRQSRRGTSTWTRAGAHIPRKHRRSHTHSARPNRCVELQARAAAERGRGIPAALWDWSLGHRGESGSRSQLPNLRSVGQPAGLSFIVAVMGSPRIAPAGPGEMLRGSRAAAASRACGTADRAQSMTMAGKPG